MASQVNSTKYLKRLNIYHFQIIAKNEDKGILPNSFYKATITLIPKPDKTLQERKLQANIFDKYRYKNPQQNISKPNLTIH